MGTIEMNKKIMELKELEHFAEEINAEIESIRDEIKAEMNARGKDELDTGAFKVRWKAYTYKRFDSARFKKDHADLYESYRKDSTTKKFTIN